MPATRSRSASAALQLPPAAAGRLIAGPSRHGRLQSLELLPAHAGIVVTFSLAASSRAQQGPKAASRLTFGPAARRELSVDGAVTHRAG